MLRVLVLLVIVIGLASVGCKKEQIPEPPVCCDTIPTEPEDNCCDTIFFPDSDIDSVFPSDYLMTYPGNWWEYSDGTTDSCFAWEETSVYEKDRIGDTVFIYEDRKTLPKVRIGGQMGHVLGGSLIIPVSQYRTASIFLVREELGIVYHSSSTGAAHHGTMTSTRTIEVLENLDSMEVDGTMYYDVIHVHYHWSETWSYLGDSGPVTNRSNFYARNIGLILEESEGYNASYKHLTDFEIQ